MKSSSVSAGTRVNGRTAEIKLMVTFSLFKALRALAFQPHGTEKYWILLYRLSSVAFQVKSQVFQQRKLTLISRKDTLSMTEWELLILKSNMKTSSKENAPSKKFISTNMETWKVWKMSRKEAKETISN